MPFETPSLLDTAMPNLPSHSRSRAHSISSDRQSSIGLYGLMSPPLSVSPDAAFIAASAASQIVTNEHDAYSATWYDQAGIEPAAETALVSNGALQLANNFVDQLLLNILATAKSTTLPSLRSAVTEILKPKLARDVINLADEELSEYLGGGEVESLTRSTPIERAGDWDLELVWKRTRLRCMVYSSLGDMEEEDEDVYLEQEHLEGETDDILAELVSPAVAIFLTSILEYIGEQVLIVAGQAAFNRLSTRYEKELKDGIRFPGDISDRVIVEELDMERVALDRTYGRLWRGWKKRIRSPLEPSFSRPFSRSSANGSIAAHQRRESTATELPTVRSSPDLKPAADDQLSRSDNIQDGAQESLRNGDEILDPSMLALPDSDVDATYSDEESEIEDFAPRPKSWFVIPRKSEDETTVALSPSVRRTPSLPSRKKPRYLISSRGDALHASKDDPLSATQLSVQSTATAEAGTAAQSGLETSRLNDENTQDVETVDGASAPNLAGTTTGATGQVNSKDLDTDGEVEEFAEEPEILTSSRVSFGGSSATASDPERPSSIVLTRSNSVCSVRVIEVQGPRSRASSVESSPHSPTPRSLSVSREGSISRTPPIVEENDHQEKLASVSSARAVHEVDAMLAPPRRNHSPPKSSRSPMYANASGTGHQQEERYESISRPTSGLRNPPMPTLPERSASRPIYSQTQSVQRGPPESPKLARTAPSESPSPAKFRPKRASEESSSNRSTDVARDFEELIHSNETLQYTLTPENMRYIDSQSPQSKASPKASPKASQTTRRSVDGRVSEPPRSSPIARSISVNRSTGLSSHPPPNTAVNGRHNNAIAKSSPPVSLKNRMGSTPQARDARVPRESMQDFAEFIRSTGPTGADNIRTNGSSSGSSITARSLNGQSVAKSSSMEARRGPKLQARDAVVNTSNESSELIDFIRRGPPSSNANNHRIPRTVAPFRNTQDSDYMTSAVGGKAVDAIIPDVRTSQSTNITEASAPSSMNSQSALLSKANRQQLHAGSSFDEEDIMPKRTQRRVRDPYAIDLSDDEDEYEDGFGTNPRPQPKQEESLIDFLNNYAPPAEPLVQPFVPPKKKSSAPNLIARLRSGSSAGLNGLGHGRRGSGVSENRNLNNRMGPKVTHTPIVVPNVVDRYASSIGSVESPRSTSYGRVPMKKFEPREAYVSRSQTADLATFLRDSQPPPSMTAYSSPSEDKATTGFSRMFERRKKPSAF
ncbi:hypothetical protein F4777DRAFT_216723 [Nemania sp. FL0916]|nr:hypothetical protein F4777DRAFT_216723 [Nemania sp. FL0916]